jgi:hypothetical protein
LLLVGLQFLLLVLLAQVAQVALQAHLLVLVVQPFMVVYLPATMFTINIMVHLFWLVLLLLPLFMLGAVAQAVTQQVPLAPLAIVQIWAVYGDH